VGKKQIIVLGGKYERAAGDARSPLSTVARIEHNKKKWATNGSSPWTVFAGGLRARRHRRL
jgi:hypothetical protein